MMKQRFQGLSNQLCTVALSAFGMAVFGIACQNVGMLQALEKSALDYAFRLRQVSETPPPVTLVVATEVDVQELGQWPPSDAKLAQALRILQREQPSIIGLNLHRDLPIAPGTAELNQLFANSNNLIGVRKVVANTNDPPLPSPRAFVGPDRVAASDLLPDRDGRLRRHLLSVRDVEGNIVLSLGARLALEHLRKQGIEQEFRGDERNVIRLGVATFRPLLPSDGGYVEAEEGGYQILSNFYDSPEVFETIRLIDLLNGQFEADQVRDRIIVVGTTASSLQNPFFVPHSRSSDETWFGTELQADLAAQVVAAATEGRPLLRGASPAAQWLWILLWASGGALLGTYLPLGRFSFALVAPVGSLVLLGSGYLCFLNGWWIVIGSPALAFVGAGVLSRRLLLDGRLARSRAQLLNYQLTLDEQIQQRTQELSQQNSQLMRAQREADAANQAKSDFLARMSHELRTPLNSIIGFSSMMRSDPSLSAVYQENLAIIRQSGEYLLTLINDVLDFSKIEAKQSTVDPDTVNLTSLVRSLESMFRFQARKKRLKFRCSIDAQVPKYIVTDEKKLRQILINLLGNALKFTPGGHVILRVWQEGTLPMQQLHFEVEDTGIGISNRDLDRIFEPFAQASNADAEAGEPGTGLGLAICRTLVKLMDGQMWARSHPGHGSRFHVTLPLQPAMVPAIAQDLVRDSPASLDAESRASVKNGSPEQREQASLRPANKIADAQAISQLTLAVGRVLIVDDSSLNRKLLKRLLDQTDMTVRDVSHGLEAIAVWETWRPDLILMDMRMPIMDGYEATRLIRKQEQDDPNILPTPIIAISASVTEQEKTAALAAGCNGLVQKPFQRDEVMAAIAQAVNVQRGNPT